LSHVDATSRDHSTEPTTGKAEAILVADGVRKSFGGLQAVAVDHFEVQRNLITALIGPNGAGKTTFFNLLTGFDSADAGSWTLNGKDVSRLPPYRVARAGMVRTFQLTKALSKMSVLDNMTLAAPAQRGEHFFAGLLRPLWTAQEGEVEANAMSLLERFGLAALADDYAGTLSGGQRKLLEMARALMAEPRLLLLDEPMAGVNPALVESLLEHIKSLRTEGRTVLFVEHDMDVVMGISDWVVCMAEGSVIAEGTPQQIATDDRVIDAYLGTHRAERHRGRSA
jgi:neutral amino acid transport system ATP-binding protein